MAIKLEKIVRTFYENLEEGKILARKCPVCGAVEYPPVYPWKPNGMRSAARAL